MDNQDGLDENIERYLYQRMTSEELEKFQEDLAADDTLRAEVELRTEMKTYLEDSPENELRRNLRKLSTQYKEKSGANGVKRPWYLLLLIPILGVLFWWANDSSTRQPARSETPAIERTEDANLQPSTPSPNESTPPTANAPTSPVSSPPLAANFAPNAALEFLLDRTTRSTGWQIAIKTAPQDVNLAEQKQIPLAFAALLSGRNISITETLQLHLFNNDPQRFTNFDPLHSFDLLLRATGIPNAYELDLSTTLSLQPGLYYTVVEDFNTEQLLWVGKFTVRQ